MKNWKKWKKQKQKREAKGEGEGVRGFRFFVFHFFNPQKIARAEPYGCESYVEMFRNEPREGQSQNKENAAAFSLLNPTDRQHDILTADYVHASYAWKACILQHSICVNLPVLQGRGKIFRKRVIISLRNNSLSATLGEGHQINNRHIESNLWCWAGRIR
jgi:hypothetical protein